MNMASLFDLTGKTALVTGGSSGIGNAVATALAYAGARVILVARDTAALAQAVERLRAKNLQAEQMTADLSLPETANTCATEALKKYPEIDILVNAAGVNLRQSFTEVTPKAWNQQINLLLAAPFFMTQGLAPHMAKRKWGRIINLASLQSFRAFENSAPYGASKGGIVQLTRATAQAWSASGVTCNAMGPGFFPTKLTDAIFANPELAARRAMQTCAQRNGKLEDLYGCAVFLASNASTYVTGQTIMIDGGFTAC